jgi:glutathione peroxidase
LGKSQERPTEERSRRAGRSYNDLRELTIGGALVLVWEYRPAPISFCCSVIYEYSLPLLEGGWLDLSQLRGRSALIVNVASECGLTPQYEGLEWLHGAYGKRGLTVIGVPCNQFGDQEPGSPEEIAEFCSSNYRVSFPLTAKLEVNGSGRHPLYEELTAAPDADGEAGDVQWNFEKFLVSAVGEVLERFRPLVAPDAPGLIAAIEAALPDTGVIRTSLVAVSP